MTARCTVCSTYHEVSRKGEKIKNFLCPCGGSLERMTHVSNGMYKNWKFELYRWEPPKFVMV